jgi:hypothetical protein
VRKVSREEFLAMFDPRVYDTLRSTLERYPDAEALVCFENLAFDSSAFGDRSAVVVGPSNTFRSVADCVGKWLNDLPSQRQYASAWVSREDFLKKP